MLTLIQIHIHTQTHTHRLRHTHAQADRLYLNSSGAKCQISSGPLGPIFFINKDSKSGLKIPQNRVNLEMIWGIPRHQVF